jgi:uncharacterized integral membrane protein
VLRLRLPCWRQAGRWQRRCSHPHERLAIKGRGDLQLLLKRCCRCFCCVSFLLLPLLLLFLLLRLILSAAAAAATAILLTSPLCFRSGSGYAEQLRRLLQLLQQCGWACIRSSICGRSV